jgi:M6 family metalloprotease-like protein
MSRMRPFGRFRRARRAVIALLTLATIITTLSVGGSAAPANALELGGARPLLVILLNKVGGPGLWNSRAYYEQLFSDRDGVTSIAEYYRVNSAGRFSFHTVGVYEVQDRDDSKLGTAAGNDLRGLVHGINLAGEAGFNYGTYDTNGDGQVTEAELAVIVIDNLSDVKGATRYGCQNPRNTSNGTQNVKYCGWRSAAGHRSAFDNVAHELSHTLHPQSQDLYFNNCRSQNFTLMSCTAFNMDQRYRQIMLDPWHRFQYGWMTLWTYDPSGWSQGFSRTLDTTPACRATATWAIARPGGKERFIIENRRRCNGDWNVGGDGIIVWYQADDPNRADGLYSATDTNVVLGSLECVFSAAHTRNKDYPGAVSSGRHRLWWGDGTDAGVDLVVNPRTADGKINVTMIRNNNGPC